MRVVHIISGLKTGGAETMLASLTRELARQGLSQIVVSLGDLGVLGPRILAQGVPVRTLGLSRAKDIPMAVVSLWRCLREFRPDVVQTWLYHADLFGGVVTRLAGRAKVVWGIHHANLDPAENKRGTLRIAYLCARLSNLIPHRIVCCAEAARTAHADIGYSRKKTIVIPNGIDLSIFKPLPVRGGSARESLEKAPGSLLVGWVGRFDSQKDPENFINAAAVVLCSHPSARFVMAGQGIDMDNSELAKRIAKTGIRENISLIGRCDTMPELYSSIDILASSSKGEAMPIGIGEAMASGIPCVVTDVGDCRELVGDTGFIAPAGDPEALGGAIGRLLEMSPEARGELGAKARRRIQERYSLPVMVEAYLDAYRNLLADGSAR